MPTMRTIAQRELRNQSGEVLRDAERGARFVVTVDGRPVAQLVPLPKSPWVSREELTRLLQATPSDPTLLRDLARYGDRVTSARDPWIATRKKTRP